MLNTIRNLLPALGYAIFLAINRSSPKVELSDMKPLVAYCVCSTLSSLGVFVSVVYIPLTASQAIFLCSGLIMALIAFEFIGETQKWIEVSM